jgi:transposase
MDLVGIDVGAGELVAERNRRGHIEQKTFANTAAGHKQVVRWMTRGGHRAQACMEATGVYSLGLALALYEADGVEVMVVNPKMTRKFAEARLVRAKTDPVDAHGICEYLASMGFVAWTPPSREVLELQAMSRRIHQLNKELTREKNRLHAVGFQGALSQRIARDLKGHIGQLERRIEQLAACAVDFVGEHAPLQADFEIIDSAPGFAQTSTVRVMSEVLPLPTDLRAAQWVAHAGLDPKPFESGSSIHKPRRISKLGNPRLRAALFMPAMVAVRCDANVKAFYEKLLANGKTKLQALVAVMRKLLHALWGMLHHRQNWDGNKFYRIPENA